MSEYALDPRGRESKINDLISRLRAEVERNALAVESITRITMRITPSLPETPYLDSVKEASNESSLVIDLRDILEGFERNTAKLQQLADRIEL